MDRPVKMDHLRGPHGIPIFENLHVIRCREPVEVQHVTAQKHNGSKHKKGTPEFTKLVVCKDPYDGFKVSSTFGWSANVESFGPGSNIRTPANEEVLGCTPSTPRPSHDIDWVRTLFNCNP